MVSIFFASVLAFSAASAFLTAVVAFPVGAAADRIAGLLLLLFSCGHPSPPDRLQQAHTSDQGRRNTFVLLADMHGGAVAIDTLTANSVACGFAPFCHCSTGWHRRPVRDVRADAFGG